MQSGSGVPVTWRDLVLSHGDQMGAWLESIRKVPSTVPMLAKPPFAVADAFAAPAALLAEALALLGEEPCRPYLDLLLPFLPEAVAGLDPDKPGRSLSAAGLIGFLQVAECLGAGIDPDHLAAAGRWLRQLTERTSPPPERERFSFALAAVALGEEELVPSFLPGGPLAPAIQPGEAFQLNAHGFIRYLASAARQRASLEDVRPAWESFLDAFPRKLAAQTLSWPDLLHAARAVFGRIGGVPADRVGRELHKSVMQAVARS